VATPIFLTLDEVLSLHADQIERYDGGSGVRDMPLLGSALGMPQTSMGGKYLHGTLAEMAAAYLFHIARNHPFVDGNKRTALMTTLIFLGLNGRSLKAGDDELTDLVLGVAAGKVSKAQTGVFIERYSRPRRG